MVLGHKNYMEDGQVTQEDSWLREPLPAWMEEEPYERPRGIIRTFNDPLALFLIRALGWAKVLSSYQVYLLSTAWKIVKGLYDAFTSYMNLMIAWEVPESLDEM